MSGNHWRRSRLGWPENAHTGTDDWTLINPSGKRLARAYAAKRDDNAEDIEWLWEIYFQDGIGLEGSASSGEEARKICVQHISDQSEQR
jgi:hypothetical protein